MRVLLLTPPMTQLNTPYPATAYLTGFLRKHGIDARQADPAIELVSKLLSVEGLRACAREARKLKLRDRSPAVRSFLDHEDAYLRAVPPAKRFLQGKDPTLAFRIVGREYLPEGPRFPDREEALDWAFGAMGVQDQAKYLASLFVDDVADMVREGIDPRFGLSRYGEKLAASVPSFDPLAEALEGDRTLIDEWLDAIAERILLEQKPDLVGLTTPFPGNVYGAFRIARVARRVLPQAKLLLGGGYVNTELRELSEPRVFDYFDFVTLDDGERPLLSIIESIARSRDARVDGRGGSSAPIEAPLLRTFVREGGKVVLKSSPGLHDIPQKDVGNPTYDGLPLGEYVSLLEMLNPMHRLWSDGRWNKLTLAHGCYWKKCNFCDVSLDYIGRYDPSSADLIVDRIEALVRETGQTGFHFVDEAAPPVLLRNLSQRLIERGVTISWWGNVRFEKTFTLELASLMARAGCLAISGGLEVASDRLLKLMNKGVSVEQVARVTRAFTDAGIMVHAYLMYGFPTQTEAETVDALERVRQLFEAGCIQSAYWHRFSATAHSPIGRAPETFGIRLLPQAPGRFAKNDLEFADPTGTDHDTLGEGLKRALYNYMQGAGLDADVRFWFDAELPETRVPGDLVARALQGETGIEAVAPGLKRGASATSKPAARARKPR
jgi:radical SAM superfamily enzyme YgiQ (UPF0313 family)